MQKGLTYAPDYTPNNFNNKSLVMSRVKVKKEDLIKVLGTNKDVHQKEYDEAYSGYLQLCIEALEERLELVKSAAKVEKDEPEVEFTMYFEDVHNPPVNHVDDYQNVIDMLEVGENEEVVIGMDEYLKYYKNNWQWRAGWELSNKAYVDKFHSV